MSWQLPVWDAKPSRTNWYDTTFSETGTSFGPTDGEHVTDVDGSEHVDTSTDSVSDPNPGEMRSHVHGQCDPCVFLGSTYGCSKGDQCGFCHHPHPELNPSTISRPRKERRRRMKEQIWQHLQGHDFDEIQQSLQSDARRNPYMRLLIPSCIDLHFEVEGHRFEGGGHR
ncbi:Uncharacterized protein SCF082_LOCUS42813 [Durusdinium trenchii]|uniref:C3H1-type domain-containing protein n=1 Tax=Durusdinium trenchii TaxID=1381693 RepID=A0ABP0QQY7_9DINO